jgi:DNA-binding MarR family transcriptional regulator
MAPLPASPHVETPAGAGSDSDALWDLLRDCHRRIRAELRAVVARHGIHLGEYRVLNRLVEGPRTPSQLAEILGLAAASMTDLVAQIHEKRWVRRRPHPSDGRAYLLALTAEGRRVRDSARQEYRTRLREVYRALPASHRTSLRAELAVLDDILRRRSGPPPPESEPPHVSSGRALSSRDIRGSGPMDQPTTRRRGGPTRPTVRRKPRTST